MLLDCVPGWVPRGPAVIRMSCEYCLATNERLPRVSLLKPLIHHGACLQGSCQSHHIKKEGKFCPQTSDCCGPSSNCMAVSYTPLILYHTKEKEVTRSQHQASPIPLFASWGGLRHDVCTLCASDAPFITQESVLFVSSQTCSLVNCPRALGS